MPTRMTRRTAILTAGAAGAAAVTTRYARASPGSAVPPPSDPPAAAEPAGFYRFRVGDVEVVALSDGLGPSPGSPHPTFAPEATRDQVDAALRERNLPTDRSVFYFNATLLRIGPELILIDAGGGALMGPRGGALERNLRAAGVTPDQITGVVLTHAHLDHFGGLLAESGQPRFRNAEHVVNRAEHDFWMSPAPDLSGLRLPEENKAAFVSMAQRHLTAVKGSLQLVRPGDRLSDALEFLDGAGHTPGHMPVLVRSGDAALLVMADLAHHFLLNFINPNWTVAFDADPKAAAAARVRLFTRAASERLPVLGYHMPWPGVGTIRTLPTGGFEWLPSPWGL